MNLYKKVALLSLPLLAMSSATACIKPVYAVEAQAQESHPAALNQYKGLIKSYDEAGQRFVLDHQAGIAVYYNDETVFIKDKKVVSAKDLDYGTELVVISDHSVDPKDVLSEKEIDTGSNYSQANSIVVARLILLKGEEDSDAVYVDHFHATHGDHKTLQADHIGMSIPIDENTKYDIKDYKGDDLDYSLEDLDGKTLAILYTAGPDTNISKDVIIPYSFKFIVLDQMLPRADLIKPFLEDSEPAITVSSKIEEAAEIKELLKPAVTVTLPATIDMLDLLPEYAHGHAHLPKAHSPKVHKPITGIMPLPATVQPIALPVYPTSDFLEMLPDWAGGKLHASELQIEEFETDPNMKLEKDAPADLVSEIVDEILEEIYEEDYYTGVEVLVDEDGIEIKVVAE